MNLVSVSALCWESTCWHLHSHSKLETLTGRKIFPCMSMGDHAYFLLLWLLSSFTNKTTILVTISELKQLVSLKFLCEIQWSEDFKTAKHGERILKITLSLLHSVVQHGLVSSVLNDRRGCHLLVTNRSTSSFLLRWDSGACYHSLTSDCQLSSKLRLSLHYSTGLWLSQPSCNCKTAFFWELWERRKQICLGKNK